MSPGLHPITAGRGFSDPELRKKWTGSRTNAPANTANLPLFTPAAPPPTSKEIRILGSLVFKQTEGRFISGLRTCVCVCVCGGEGDIRGSTSCPLSSTTLLTATLHCTVQHRTCTHTHTEWQLKWQTESKVSLLSNSQHASGDVSTPESTFQLQLVEEAPFIAIKQFFLSETSFSHLQMFPGQTCDTVPGNPATFLNHSSFFF